LEDFSVLDPARGRKVQQLVLFAFRSVQRAGAEEVCRFLVEGLGLLFDGFVFEDVVVDLFLGEEKIPWVCLVSSLCLCRCLQGKFPSA